VILFVLACPSAQANTVECGGNSFSYGEVVQQHRGRARKGVVEAIPDSLCADLIEIRPREIESLHLTIDPRARTDRPPAGTATPIQGLSPAN
jgi:hypothetical protein